MTNEGGPRDQTMPEEGTSESSVLESLRHLQESDVDWKRGRSWAYVYFAGDDVLEVAARAYTMAMSGNGLSGRAFPSIAACEREVVAWVRSLVGGACGVMTSGGSESIFLAVKTARDRKRVECRDRPMNIVVPYSSHPAFAKAAHYLGLEMRRAALRSDLRVDVASMEALCDDCTALLVGSAPSYPHGVVDDIPEVAGLASARDIPCHVDACVGGMVLPFALELGRWRGSFDFCNAGVTSMSIDLHKFGYTAKGASAVLYATEDMLEQQGFTFDAWTGGRYSAPNMTGTRPGGAIAAAWAVMRFLGKTGYRRLVAQALDATAQLSAGIADIEGLAVVSDPDICLIAFGDRDGRIADVAAELTRRGWVLGTQGPSPQVDCTIHLTVTSGHQPFIGEFLRDLRGAVEIARSGAPSDAAVGGYN